MRALPLGRRMGVLVTQLEWRLLGKRRGVRLEPRDLGGSYSLLGNHLLDTKAQLAHISGSTPSREDQ